MDTETTSGLDFEFIRCRGKSENYLTLRLGHGQNTTASSREYIRSNLWSIREKTSLTSQDLDQEEQARFGHRHGESSQLKTWH